MYCSQILGIKQYVLEGIIISEIGKKYLINQDYIKPLLDVKILDKQKISDLEFKQLIENFYKQH